MQKNDRSESGFFAYMRFVVNDFDIFLFFFTPYSVAGAAFLCEFTFVVYYGLERKPGQVDPISESEVKTA